ncbi:MAG TPA: hypothetical protein VGS57_10220 [Thermoanaerobaculia bacterium]|nr:hypothetical protein [Thermoanaerobaculia bacterium]
MARKRRNPSDRRPSQPPAKAPAAPEPLSERRRWLGILAAAAAALGWLTLLRVLGPHPWDYDEYYHVWLARQMRGGMPSSFPWTPFSTMHEHFSDPVPLFHLVLMPFAGLTIEKAALAGAFCGQLLVVGALAWVLGKHRVPYAPVWLLGLTALGTNLVTRLAMCRPHHGEIAFTILFVGLLLLDASPIALGVVAAVFGLFHASGWMPVLFATLWLLAPESLACVPRRRRWIALAAAAVGWALGQLLHPHFLDNLRLLWTTNVTILSQSAAGDSGLRSQIGNELQPLSGDLLMEQWPALLAAGALVYLLARRPEWRRREVLAVGFLALAFLVPGIVLWRRFFELGAPLTLLALALGTARVGSGPNVPALSKRAVYVLGALIATGSIYTFLTIRATGIGRVSPPDAMARWLAEHGSPNERVFTANWADSAPLLYYAPRLQSLVALDPTAFWVKDPELFALYVRIIDGREMRPAAIVRDRFGARWVTIWKAPNLKTFATRMVRSGEASVVFNDPFYLVLDLGPPARPATAG